MASDDENDLEKVGLFKDGPYDTDVTLYRPDIVALMGRSPDPADSDLTPFIPPSGHKLKAGTNDWPFEPFAYLYEDGLDEYEDPGTWRRRYQADQDEKIISDQSFIPSAGAKDMNGSGTYYGTFIEEMEAFSPEQRDKPYDEELRNLYTNPGKKGTGYGYVDVGIGPYPEHEDDPYFDSVEALREAREEHEAKAVSENPFIPPGVSQPYFDPNPYYNDRDPDGEIETYDFDRLKAETENEDAPPFVPAGVTKKINGNKDVLEPLEKFPEYDPSDPYDDPPQPNQIFRQSKNDDDEKQPWKPPMRKKTRQVRSVISYNVGIRVNATNFHKFL